MSPERIVPERSLPPLGVLVFAVGAAALGTEIAAARLLAPFFGASTVVWANTIGVVLVSLSVGYWLGGRFADRNPHLPGLCALVLIAALAVAAIPFAASPFLDVSVTALDRLDAGAFVGSLLAVTILVAPPVILLGAASPYAIRLALTSVEESGAVAGRLYAISTVGSLVGTFLSALVLIPLLGTRRTFLVFALACAAVAALGVTKRRLSLAAPAAIVVLLALPAGTIKAANDGRLLKEVDTSYQYARVVEHEDGERRLELNEGLAVHSVYTPGRYLADDYWDEFLVAPFLSTRRPPKAIAILGNGAGTVARGYGYYFPGTDVDAVEIDGELTGLGERYFDMRNSRMRIYTEDARPFLRKSDRSYGMIAVDAYRQPYIPFYLATREFFELARERLTPDGVLAVNIGHPRGDDRLEKALSATIADVFPLVIRNPSQGTNTILLASGRQLSRERLRFAARRLPADLRPLARETARRTSQPLPGGSVYTDDRAPVELLTDRAIVEYAASGEGR